MIAPVLTFTPAERAALDAEVKSRAGQLVIRAKLAVMAEIARAKFRAEMRGDCCPTCGRKNKAKINK